MTKQMEDLLRAFENAVIREWFESDRDTLTNARWEEAKKRRAVARTNLVRAIEELESHHA